MAGREAVRSDEWLVVKLSAWTMRLVVRLPAWSVGWWSRMVRLVVRLSAWVVELSPLMVGWSLGCLDGWLVVELSAWLVVRRLARTDSWWSSC